ncbi:MAG: glycosyltransferase, partial [Myxococcales bacterium]|nr:glycosyltransferase [Myxococcales bacterium]
MEAPGGASPIGRLQTLRAHLVGGDVAAAIALTDAWLAELGAAPEEIASPVEAPVVEGAPRFSVLMAAYNRADLIGEAIESALGQDFADFELIISDDGSTDATPEIVRRYAAADRRVRFFRSPQNQGRSPTRNRAIAEARGEFVLWMADDDLLVPGLLRRYDAILRAEPQIDVLYGDLQIFDGDTGRDLNVFRPDDWTGRDALLLGAKLFGSCVPDGGTATRRALYEGVTPEGALGPYDPEFVRAQDYELWTRLLDGTTVRKLDAVVYRYRKHEGGTSWGSFVDLSFDSKIIRRHLARHALERLFPRYDWSMPAASTRRALLRMARNLSDYQDHHNALGLLAAVAEAAADPAATEARIIAHLGRGDVTGAENALAEFVAAQPLPHTLTETLRARIDATAELRRAGRAALTAGKASEAEQRAVTYQNAYGLTFDVALLRGLAHRHGGDPELALAALCQAARLDPTDDESAQAAGQLAQALGRGGPKVDVAAMRRRLLEPLYTPPVLPAPPPETGPAITVLCRSTAAAALASVQRQRYAPVEVRVINGTDPVEITTPLACWIDEGTGLLPGHLARAAAALAEAEEDLVVAPRLGEPALAFDRARLLAEPWLSAAGTVWRTERVDLAPVLAAEDDWDRLLALTEGRAVRMLPVAGCAAPVPVLDRATVQAVYRRHQRETLFDVGARAWQAEVLGRFGLAQAARGRTSVVIVGDDRAALATTLAAVRAHTPEPHHVVLVADAADAETTAWLRAESAADDDLRVVALPRALGRAHAVNLGLARAHGEHIALLRAGVKPGAKWLGRLLWWAGQHAEAGIIVPGMPASRLPDRCLLIARAVLDRVGGFDVTLDAPDFALDDWTLRVRLAGFAPHAVDDIALEGKIRWPDGPDADRLRARWGVVPTAESLPPATAAFDPAVHFIAPGAEDGFRPDARPVRVEEAAARNVLIMPPWDDAAALKALVAHLAALPADAAVWLRAAPDEGPRRTRQLEAAARAARVDLRRGPTLLI